MQQLQIIMCSVVTAHMKDEYLPDQQYQQLTSVLRRYFLDYKIAPQYGVLEQMLSQSRAVSELLEEIRETSTDADADALRDQFENYLKLVRFKKPIKR